MLGQAYIANIFAFWFFKTHCLSHWNPILRLNLRGYENISHIWKGLQRPASPFIPVGANEVNFYQEQWAGSL